MNDLMLQILYHIRFIYVKYQRMPAVEG